MLSAEQGLLRILAVNASVCITGFCLLGWLRAELVANYISYGIAGALCMYLIDRYIVGSVHPCFENRIAASPGVYLLAGCITAVPAMIGVLKTADSGEIDGLAYMSFVAFGGEFGELRKIHLRKRE